MQKARKTTGPQNRAIWEDKEYQEKYGNVHIEEEEKVDVDKRLKSVKELEEKEKKREKPMTETQRLYEMAKSQAQREEDE